MRFENVDWLFKIGKSSVGRQLVNLLNSVNPIGFVKLLYILQVCPTGFLGPTYLFFSQKGPSRTNNIRQ